MFELLDEFWHFLGSRADLRIQYILKIRTICISRLEWSKMHFLPNFENGHIAVFQAYFFRSSILKKYARLSLENLGDVLKRFLVNFRNLSFN